MDRILIDSDVILDFFFDRIPFSEHAAQVLSMSEDKKIHCFITPVICSNVYYLLRRNAGNIFVIEKLSQLLSIVDILTMDKEVVLNALKSEFSDFEDALQNSTAELSGDIDYILTRNLKDYKHSRLKVLSPSEYLKIKLINPNTD